MDDARDGNSNDYDGRQVTIYKSRGSPRVDGVDVLTFPGQYLSRPLPGTPLHMVLVTKQSPVVRKYFKANEVPEDAFLYHNIWLLRKAKKDLEYCSSFWSLAVKGLVFI